MSDHYAKLWRSILDSTLWSESAPTKVVWITMLAEADAAGNVLSTVPGLARRAVVSLAECETALATFLAPDKFSRTPDQEGRRIVPIPGGWHLINHEKHSLGREQETRRQQVREAARRFRKTRGARHK